LLSAFLDAAPVITEGPCLVEAKRLVEHARGAMAELETERDQLVRPLNEQVANINIKYKAIHNTDSKKPGTFDKVLAELKARLTAFAREEEAKRERAAELARIAAEQAEVAAREAERLEQEAKANAAVGEVDTGVVDAIATADRRFAEFEASSRFAARTERETTFRIGDGGTKALSMRTEKTLVLENYGRAIKAIGPNDKIESAILSAARDYRKLHGKLPDGVTEVSERRF
jgi:regulator of protease activity HflC (stomatin/prohibitin superfamily)